MNNLILAPEAFKCKKKKNNNTPPLLYIIKLRDEEIISSRCKSLQVLFTYINSDIVEGLILLMWQAKLFFCLEDDQVMDIAEWSKRLHREPSKPWIGFLNLIRTIALKCQSVGFFITSQYGWQVQETCIWIQCSECFSLSALNSGLVLFGWYGWVFLFVLFLNQPPTYPWNLCTTFWECVFSPF